MAIRLKCKECGANWRVSDAAVGKKKRCPACEAVVLVRDPAARTAPPDRRRGAGGKSRPATPSSDGISGGVIALLCCGGVLFAGLVGGGIWLLTRGEDAPEVAQAADDAQAAPPNPGRPEIQPGPPPIAAPAGGNVAVAEADPEPPNQPALVEPPPGELEELENFDADGLLAAERLATMTSSKSNQYQSVGDLGHNIAKTTFEPSDPSDYRIERTRTALMKTQHITRDARGATIIGGDGSVGATRAVSAGETFAVGFSRETPRHSGQLAGAGSGNVAGEAAAELRKIREARAAVQQNRDVAGDARSNKQLEFLAAEERRLRARVGATPKDSGGKYGAAVGGWELRHANGQPRVVGHYASGVRQGRFLCCDESGSPIWEGFYNSGKLVSSRSLKDQPNPYGSLRELIGHSSAVNDVSLSSDGQRVATVSGSGGPLTLGLSGIAKVVVWEVASGRPLCEFSTPHSRVSLSPKGRSIALFSRDHGELRSVDGGKLIGQFSAGSGSSRVNWVGPNDSLAKGFSRLDAPVSWAFSPDGTRFAVVTTVDRKNGDKTIALLGAKVWNTLTGELIATVPEAGSSPNAGSPGHLQVNRLQFVNDQLLVGIGGLAAGVLDVEAGAVVGKVARDGAVTNMPDMTVGSEALEAHKRYVALSQIVSPDNDYWQYALSHDGRWLLHPSEQYITLYDLASGDFVYRLPASREEQNGRRTRTVGILATESVTPNRSAWVGVGPGNKRVLRSFKTGDQLGPAPSQNLAPTSLDYLLIDGAGNARVAPSSRRHFDVVNATNRQSKRFSGPSSLVGFACSADGKSIVAGYADGAVLVFDSSFSPTVRQNNGPPVVSIENCPDEATVGQPVTVEVKGSDPDNDQLRYEVRAAGDDDWTYDTDETVAVLADASGELEIEVVAVDPSGARSDIARHTVKVSESPWRSWGSSRLLEMHNSGQTGRQSRGLPTLEYPVLFADGKTGLRRMGAEDPYVRLAFSPDGSMLTGINKERLRNWELSGKQRSGVASSQPLPTSAAAWSADNKILWTGTDSGALHAWDIAGKKMKSSQPLGKDDVLAIAVTPDGQTLAASVDNGVSLVSTETLQKLAEVPLPELPWRLVIDPSGNRLACQWENVVCWVSFSRRQVEGTYSGTAQRNTEFADLVFSPSGDQLYVLERYSPKVHILDIGTGKPVDEFGPLHSACNTIAMHPSGNFFAAGGRAGAIGLYDAHDGRLVKLLQGHSGDVYDLQFSGDGSVLASCGGDGTVRLWGGEAQAAGSADQKEGEAN